MVLSEELARCIELAEKKLSEKKKKGNLADEGRLTGFLGRLYFYAGNEDPRHFGMARKYMRWEKEIGEAEPVVPKLINEAERSLAELSMSQGRLGRAWVHYGRCEDLTGQCHVLLAFCQTIISLGPFMSVFKTLLVDLLHHCKGLAEEINGETRFRLLAQIYHYLGLLSDPSYFRDSQDCYRMLGDYDFISRFHKHRLTVLLAEQQKTKSLEERELVWNKVLLEHIDPMREEVKTEFETLQAKKAPLLEILNFAQMTADAYEMTGLAMERIGDLELALKNYQLQAQCCHENCLSDWKARDNVDRLIAKRQSAANEKEISDEAAMLLGMWEDIQDSDNLWIRLRARYELGVDVEETLRSLLQVTEKPFPRALIQAALGEKPSISHLQLFERTLLECRNSKESLLTALACNRVKRTHLRNLYRACRQTPLAKPTDPQSDDSSEEETESYFVGRKITNRAKSLFGKDMNIRVKKVPKVQSDDYILDDFVADGSSEDYSPNYNIPEKKFRKIRRKLEAKTHEEVIVVKPKAILFETVKPLTYKQDSITLQVCVLEHKFQLPFRETDIAQRRQVSDLMGMIEDHLKSVFFVSARVIEVVLDGIALAPNSFVTAALKDRDQIACSITGYRQMNLVERYRTGHLARADILERLCLSEDDIDLSGMKLCFDAHFEHLVRCLDPINLNLFYNQLDDRAAEHLVQKFKNSKRLRSLNLSCNLITKVRIFDSLLLEHLNLSFNPLIKMQCRDFYSEDLL